MQTPPLSMQTTTAYPLLAASPRQEPPTLQPVTPELADHVACTWSPTAVLNESASKRLAETLPRVPQDHLLYAAAAVVGHPAVSLALQSTGAGVSGSAQFIATTDGTRVAVIKRAKHEVQLAGIAGGMQILNDPANGFHIIRSPRVLGMAMLEGSNKGLVAMGLAPGRSVESLPPQELPAACFRAGQALAELHTVPPGSGTRVPTAHVGRQLSKMAYVLGILHQNEDRLRQVGLDPKAIEQSARASSEAYQKNPGTNSIVHGDYHAGNLTVGDGDHVHVLDSAHLPESVDEQGRPNGSPARDLAQFQWRLTRKVDAGRLQPSEAEEARQAFIEGYGDAITRVTPEALRFANHLVALEELAVIVSDKNPDAMERLKGDALPARIASLSR